MSAFRRERLPTRNAAAFLTPFLVFLIKKGFRPLQRATKGRCPLETRKPLKRLDLNFTVTLFVRILLFSRFFGRLKRVFHCKRPVFHTIKSFALSFSPDRRPYQSCISDAAAYRKNAYARLYVPFSGCRILLICCGRNGDHSRNGCKCTRSRIITIICGR